MTAILNQIAEKWFSWQLSMFWQVGLLIIIVAGLDLLIKKWVWPQVRYALWLLILVKLVLPPTLTSPMSFTAEIPFMVKQTAIKIRQPQTSPHAIKPVIVPVTELIPADTTIQPVEVIPAPYTAPATPAGAFLSGKTYVFFVWLVGVGILSGWLIIRLSNLRHQHLKDKQSNLPERLEYLLVSTARKLGLKKTPQVILTNKVCCPAVFGIFRPVLLMPADKLQNMTLQDAENIFLHELAHIKRGDLFVHAVYMILQIAYWFNPLLWLIRKNLQNLRELCCDATVARLLKEKTIGYRQTLLETARQLLAEPVAPGLGLLGLFENSSWLVDRLGWLEKKSWKYRPLRITTIFVLISLMAACVLPMTKFEAPVDFVIKGTVTDAQTGKSIAGAKVGDTEKYADGKFYTTTDVNGNYSYKTYYEEHGVKAEANGYKRQNTGFGTKLFGKEKEKVINFALEREKRPEELKKQKLQNLVEDFFKDNYRDIKQRKTIEWEEPVFDANGNQSIRYKYEARIWDKDKYIFDELFTFNKDGKFVSAKKISQILKDYPADNKSSAGQILPQAGEQDYAQIKNVMVTLGGTFDAAYSAAFQQNSPDSAAKIMEESLPQFEKFELDVKGTNISGSVHLIIEQIRQAIKANKDGDSVIEKALIAASRDSWNRLEQIIMNDYRNMLNVKSLEDAQKKKSELQKPAEQNANEGSKSEVYIVKFHPNNNFNPRTAGELLKPFNDAVRGRVKTHHFRTKVEEGKLAGYILCDSRAEQKAIALMLADNQEIEFIGAELATEDGLVKHYASEQQSLDSADEKATFDQLLSKKVTVDIDKSPDGSGLTVQYAVIAVCEAAGVPYKWEKSAQLAEPQRRKFIEPLHIKEMVASEAITDILKPPGLNYAIDSDGLFIYKIKK